MSRHSKPISARLAQVQRLPAKLRIAALGEGLAACSPDESEALALELLELAVFPAFADNATPVRARTLFSFMERARRAQVARLADRALAEISRRWGFIPSTVIPAALAAGENRWQDVIRQVATDPSRLPRLSLAKLAADAGDARLSALAASMLFDQDEEVAQGAERALVTLALSLLRQDVALTTCATYLVDEPEVSGGRGLVLGLSGNPDELCSQLTQAAMNYGEHRRRAPILGALVAAERARLRSKKPGAAAMRTWLNNRAHPSQGALRSVLRWTRMPVARLRALEWLHVEHLTAPAGERLLRAHKLIEHELVLANAHLLARPARATCAAKLKIEPLGKHAGKGRPRLPDLAEGAAPTTPALRQLSPAARLRFPSFLGAFSTAAPFRAKALEPYLSDPIPSVRHAAMRGAPASLLPDFCFDDNHRVAQSAFLSWSSAGAALPTKSAPIPDGHRRALSLLARSPHEAIRTWADQDLDVACGWLTPSLAGRLAARRAMATDRPAFVERLRATLSIDDQAPAGVALVRALDLAPELEPDLIRLTGTGTPPRLLATVIAALSPLTSEAARAAITQHLTHPNDRVRANAVEALGVNCPSILVELKSDENHRVRANSIRAEFLATIGDDLPPQDLAAELSRILTDSRPMHRLAGLWLAVRTLPRTGRAALGDEWPQLMARIGEAARFDEDPRIRARAAACAYRLASHTRLSWRAQPTHAS
jgi:hypothetical protein